MFKRLLTGWLQASAANQEPIDIGLLSQISAVLLGNTSAIEDASVFGSLSRDSLLEPLANSSVDLLGLCSGGDLAGTNRPTNKISISKIIPSRRVRYQMGS